MPESLAQRLGFDDEARVAIVHADDIGMCHAANDGGLEVLANGPATCGSLMVPCPWFTEAAAFAVDMPDIDLGVHLTLNAEWAGYRWGPVLGPSAVPSLCAPDGGLLRTTAETVAAALPAEVEAELRAQIETALAAGIDVTHLDAHMGTAFMPPFVSVYTKLAREFRLPVLALRPDPSLANDRALDLAPLLAEVDALAADGWPILDGLCADSLHFEPGGGQAHNRERLRRLAPGVTYLICHPARGGEELDAIAPEAHCREFERTFYGGNAGREALASEGITTVGMRALRDLLRRH